MKGRLIYRCRLCGWIDRASGTNDVRAAVVLATMDDGEAPPVHHLLLDVHVCGTGVYGVMDLIGTANDLALRDTVPGQLPRIEP